MTCVEPTGTATVSCYLQKPVGSGQTGPGGQERLNNRPTESGGSCTDPPG